MTAQSNPDLSPGPLMLIAVIQAQDVDNATDALHRLNLTVISEEVDPAFRFMTLDWDGRIRMDPSSPYAMRRLIGLKDKFDVVAACDTDHDRHGIVTRSAGLLPPNHYLAVCIDYLYRNRDAWPSRSRRLAASVRSLKRSTFFRKAL